MCDVNTSFLAVSGSDWRKLRKPSVNSSWLWVLIWNLNFRNRTKQVDQPPDNVHVFSQIQNPCYTAMCPSFVGPSCLRCEQLVSEPRGCWIIYPRLFIFTFTYVYKSNDCPLRWFQQFRSIWKRERKRNFSHTRKKGSNMESLGRSAKIAEGWLVGRDAKIYQIASFWSSCVINPWTGKRDTSSLHAWKEIITIECAVKGSD